MTGRVFGRNFPKNHQRGLSWAAIGLLLLVTTVPTQAAPSALSSVIALTTAEQAWLKAHPDITFGFTDAFEPAVIVNQDGSYRGTLVDFLDLLNQRLGTDFKITVKPISDVFSQVSRKELAGVLSLHPDNADKRGFLKTQVFMISYPTVFTRKGVTFSAPADLAGKKIAIIDNVFFSQNLVDIYADGSTIIKVKSALEGLERVKDGTADLFIGSSRNSYPLGKYQFFDLAATFEFFEHSTPNVMAVRSDWPQLVAILNKGLAAISVEEKESIERKWIGIPEQNRMLELTAEERDWLALNPRIKVGIYSVPPYMYKEDGRFKGYLVDMIQSLTNQAGLTAEFSMQPLAETLAMVKSGQTHVVLGMIHSEERAGFMYFSENIMEMQMGIFARLSRSDINDAGSLENKVIASYKGYGFEPVIKKYLPNARIIRADDTEGMFRLVASGEADAAMQELYSGEFILRDSFINGVNRKGLFEPPGLPAITGSEFAVSRKFPILNSILNKSYNTLPESEKNRTWRKWFGEEPVTSRAPALVLTSAEQAWLAEHPTITLGGGVFPPLDSVDNSGRAEGIGPDYARLIGNILGIEFNYFTDDWKKIQEMAKAKQIDGIRLLLKNADRESYLNFTQPYTTLQHAILTQKSSPDIRSLSGLTGKRVGTMNAVYAHRYMQDHYPEIKIVTFPNVEENLRALVGGDVDAVVASLAVAGLIMDKLFITNLKVTALPDELSDDLHMGIRKDWPEFIPILDKAIAAIPRETNLQIKNRWISHDDQIDGRPLELSTEEQAWLAKTHAVRVRTADWPPYLIIKDNEPPQGIVIEYLKLIGKRSGITFEFEVTEQPFAQFLESMKKHQGPDMTALIVNTPEREPYLSFTEPYISSPYVIFAREQEELIMDISGLTEKTLAVTRGFIVEELLTRDYPEIKRVLFDSDEQALQAVATGQADAYIGSLTAASHIIQKRGLTDLRVVAPTPFGDQVLAMGNRSDWPELTSIIDKALASITEAEKTAIRDKYVAVRYDQGINRAEALKWILLVVGGASGVVFFFVFWNRSLASRVRHRTTELENTTESLKTEIAERNQAETALQKSRRFTDHLIETANVMIVGLDHKGKVNLFNPAAERITGYTISELNGKNWFEILSPNERYPQVHLEFSRLMDGGLPKSFQNPILTKNGEERVISWSNNEVKEGNQTAGTLSFGIDITERSRAEEALLESEEKFRYLVEQFPLSIQIFDLDGRIVQVNEAWKALWGISEEQLPEVFEKYNILEDEEARKLGVLPLIEKAFKGEGAQLPVIDYDASTTLEAMAVGDAGGNKRWVRAQFYPRKDRSGVVVNVVSIEEDITSSIHAEQEILQYQQRLKALASQLTIAEEKERRKIAADLHDHVGHSLALARMQLNGILESDSDLERNILVKDISNIMLQALQDTRSLIFELSSPSMNEIGLGAAISEWLEEQIEKRHGLKTEFSDTIEKEHRKALDESVRALLFRNVRELLTNVVKHARAKKVSVSLKEHANSVTVVIEDDGIGFDPEAVKIRNGKQGGFGLFSIHERMSNLGGTFDIQSAPGNGCRVVLTVPVEKGSIVLNRRKSR